MWGHCHKKYLPIEWEERRLTREQGIKAGRIQRKWRERKGRRWLHSVSTHDSLRSQGKPTKWHRVKLVDPFRQPMPGEPREVPELGYLLDNYRSWGFRVKRIKPKLFRKIEVNVLWSTEPGTSRLVRDEVRQVESICSGWVHIDSGEYARMLGWLTGSGPPRRLTACERRWMLEEKPGREAVEVDTMADDVPF
jgi:hypothetical protein